MARATVKESDMDFSASKVLEELGATPKLMIGGEEITIPRFGMKKIFLLIRLMHEGLGDVFDMIDGSLSSDLKREFMQIIDQDQAAMFWRQHAPQMADTINEWLNLILSHEEVVYDLTALATGKEKSWIEENVRLETFIELAEIIIRQELTNGFFLKLESFRKTWDVTKRAAGPIRPNLTMTSDPDDEETETRSDGSGLSAAN